MAGWISAIKRSLKGKGPASESGAQASANLTTRQRGDAVERAAQRHLELAGLRLVDRNFKTPGRGGGEIDLIMQEPDGTLVFVEVRYRARTDHGGAAASVTPTKQRRVVLAARHYLLRLPTCPPCRFDVVTCQPARTQAGNDFGALEMDWIRAAFEASV